MRYLRITYVNKYCIYIYRRMINSQIGESLGGKGGGKRYTTVKMTS